jgi:hypothetical protein
MTTPVIPEGAPRTLTVSFFDDAGQPAAPASVSYRVDCLTSKSVVVNDTQVLPSAVVSIALSGVATAMVNAANSREKRRVTVTATDIDGVEPGQFDYFVKNMSGV